MQGRSKSTSGWCAMAFVLIAPLVGAAQDPPLAEAVKHRDAQAVHTLLKQGVDVNAALADGTTALHWAVHRDDPATVDLLIAAGARVNVADDYDVTPLWLACTNRNSHVVEQLLKAGANPNATLPTAETVLMRAAHTGSADVVNLLLEERGVNVNARETTLGQTALMWAAAEGHAEVVRALIGHGADVHARSTARYTAFLLSARNTDLTTAEALLDAGADVNEAAYDGTTALVIATIRGNTTLAKLLLEKGADANAGPGFAPLHRAVDDPVDTLRGMGRNPDEDSEWSIFAGLPGPAKVELVKALLAHGANPNLRAARRPSYERRRANAGPGLGATPFWIAARVADIEMMRLLLASGADPSLATSRNVTPLMVAAGVSRGTGNNPVPQSRAVETVKLCMENGNDVNAVSADGETALHGAVYRGPQGSESLIRLLVDNGAKVNVKNKHGWTPLTIAEGLYFDAHDTFASGEAELLRKLGAHPSPPDIDRQFGSRTRVNR